MTEPTQEQIDAAAIAIIGLWEKPYNFEAMAKAALTAAAEADGGLQALKDKWQTYTIIDIRAAESATIERCAQVAESFRSDNPYPTVYAAIAAAIRALTKVSHSPS